MKTERVVIQIVVFRDDGDGAQDMDAVWRNLCDALFQIQGVEMAFVHEREILKEADPAAAAEPSGSEHHT